MVSILVIFIEYLIEKDFIQTIEVQTKGQGIFHRCYQIIEKEKLQIVVDESKLILVY